MENVLNRLARKIYPEGIEDTVAPGILTKANCSGKTTALALRYISEAMANPGKEVKLVGDHGGNSPVHNKFFRAEVERLVIKLDFYFFVFNQVRNTIMFDI